MKNIHKRLIYGAGAGFLALFILSLAFLRANGWLGASVSPYAGPPPLMTALVFGFVGLVFGAFIGILKH